MTTVTFADLTHTGVAVDANNIPLAVGYIAALCQDAPRRRDRRASVQVSGSTVAVSAPDRRRRSPASRTTCGTADCSCTFAKDDQASPPGHRSSSWAVRTIPSTHRSSGHTSSSARRSTSSSTAKARWPSSACSRRCRSVDFDADRLKANGVHVPSVHYLSRRRVRSRAISLPRILELDKHLPSPYTMGLLDEFFDDKLTPMIQTSRGCPYSCTFCHDGIPYMNKTRAFSQTRVREELAYIDRAGEDRDAAAGRSQLGDVPRRPAARRSCSRTRGDAAAGRATS